MFTLAAWNINSIRTRLPLLLSWLKERTPDIVLLQETKVIDDQFPSEEIENLGYNIAMYGQKSYNGVAILSKFPIEDVTQGIPGFEDDQARYLEAVIKGMRVASVYVPNGMAVGSDKYAYKLDFLKHLYLHTQTLLTYDEAFVMGGDFNIAPSDLDVYDPEEWHEKILCSTAEREAFRSLLYLGLTDALRALHPNEKELYTWWDYQRGSWQNNFGLRIDHFLLSPQAADLLKEVSVDKQMRDVEKASDHAPVLCKLEL
ncbi:MAG: exodeoxyribonuclease III [Alphaproteobacteria bacterium 41-28]|nr:MAG: exodeoxyribonuclease III [Alphaproteobacteria bacterium 41-28]